MKSNSRYLVTEILSDVPLPMALLEPIFHQETIQDLQVLWVNDEFTKQFEAAPLAGVKISQAFPGILNDRWLRKVAQSAKTSATVSEYIQMSVEGLAADIYVKVSTHWAEDQLIASIVLLSQSTLNQDNAIHAASIMSRLMPALPISYYLEVAGDKWIKFPTKKFLDNIGIDLADFLHVDLISLVPEDEREKLQGWLHTKLASRTMPLITKAVAKDGTERWVELWASNLPSSTNEVREGNLVVMRDVNIMRSLQQDNQRMAEQLQQQLRELSLALNASSDGFAIWQVVRNPDGSPDTFTLSFINAAGAAATGKIPSSLQGGTLEQVVGENESAGLRRLFMTALATGEPQREVVSVDSPTGWAGAYENQVMAFGKDELLASFRDVSDERREHKRLLWLTEHDYLTGIPNRSQLEAYLQQAISQSKLSDQFVGFVFIDIDHFKSVNDKFGHEVGDALLVNFAKRVKHSLPNSAFVGRIAGDEFAIVLEKLDDRAKLNDLMQEVFRSMARPFNQNTPELNITCSAGCVITDGTDEVAEVIRLADRSMYQAKHEGRNKFIILDRFA